MAPVQPEEDACGVEDNGVDDADDDVGYAVAIEVLGAKVETAWVEVADHPGGYIASVAKAETHTNGRVDRGQDSSRRREHIGEGLH